MSAFDFKEYLGWSGEDESASGDGAPSDAPADQPPELEPAAPEHEAVSREEATVAVAEGDEEGDEALRDELATLFASDAEAQSEPARGESGIEQHSEAESNNGGPAKNHASPDESTESLDWLAGFIGGEEVEQREENAEETSAAPRAEDEAPPEIETQPADDPAPAPPPEPPREEQEDASDSLELEDLPEAASDEVVSALVRRGLVTLSQVAQAVQQREHADTPLWRVLADRPNVDRQAAHAEAARVQGIAPAELPDGQPTTTFLHAVLTALTPAVSQQLIDTRLFPYRLEEEPQPCLLVASSDPTRPEVAEATSALNLDVEVRYVPEAALQKRVNAMRELYATLPDEAKINPNGTEAAIADVDDASEEQSAGDATPDTDTTSPPHGAEDPPQETGEPAGLDDLITVPGSADSTDTPDEAAAAPGPTDAPPEHRDGDSGEQAAVRHEAAAEDAPDEADGPGGDADQEVQGVDAGADTRPPLTENGQADLGVAEPLEEEPPEAPPEASTQEIAPSAPDGDEALETEEASPAADAEEPAQEAEPSELDLEVIKAEDRVVSVLLNKDIVSPAEAREAKAQKEKNHSAEALWRVLARGEDVHREAIYAEAAHLYAFRAARLEERAPDPDFVRRIVTRFSEEKQERLLEMRVLPYESRVDEQTGAGRLVFITHDPTRPAAHRLMHQLEIERFELWYAPEAAVSDLIAEAFPKKNEYLERIEEEDVAMDLGAAHEDEEALVDEEALEAEMSRSKLINLFEAALVDGVREGASDVHIYPNADKKVEIHFRTDGRLHHWHTEDKIHPEALLAVIKDNAMNVDRFERDAAQDGFIQRKIDGALIRFRVSVLPIANASQEIRSESIVIRILDDRKVITDLGKLGLLDTALERFHKAIRQPHGMVILTGPTGSGKSTTLVASLHQVLTPDVNVLTVEDPVEYIIEGVRQIKLNNKLTLDGALRSILRHDPDIVMVGEMRDRQTAELAIKLANTGHLTFSTLHTNDAPSAISRLYKMDIEPFLIAYAINLVVAQRLIRTLCPDCKRPDPDPDPVLLRELGFSEEEIDHLTFYLAGDDRSCSCGGTGYQGRRAISEALYFSREIRHMIVDAEGMIDESAIRDAAENDGMLSLQASAREVIKAGETSVREMMRVVAADGA